MRLTALYLLPGLLAAHVISMSTGALTVEGLKAHYSMRVPLYELQHVPEPSRMLPDAISLANANRISAECKTRESNMECVMEYVYAAPPGEVRVQCKLSRVTVPNHVHVLHARRENNSDQAVFDSTMEQAVLRFRDAGPIESAIRARPALLIGAFAVLATLVMLVSGWGSAVAAPAGYAASLGLSFFFAPQFAEAVLALSIAYAAFETAFLPAGRWKWVLASVVSAALGLMIGPMLSGARPRAIIGLAVIGPGVAAGLILARRTKPRKWMSYVLIVAGVSWFTMTML